MIDSCTSKASSVEATYPDAGWLHRFAVPDFRPHPLLRGGHLQTLVTGRMGLAREVPPSTHRKHRIDLGDGDALMMHDNEPIDWDPRRGSVLLLHGICGCHAAQYMVRFQRRLNRIGIRTFRVDMRGCGDSAATCKSITHAGRSDDVLATIEFIGELTRNVPGPLGVAGVSLGGNQILLAAGQVAAGTIAAPTAWSRVGPILAIAPPLDLQLCSDALEAWRLRFYNWYFIRQLIKRAALSVGHGKDSELNELLKRQLRGRIPKTLRHFDRNITAPLGGFRCEADYYRRSSAISVADRIAVPTLVVTSQDDPLVPLDSFGKLLDLTNGRSMPNSPVRLHVTRGGGHHGYVQRDRTSWSDELVCRFFGEAFGVTS